MFFKRKWASVIFLHPFAGEPRISISSVKNQNPVYMQNNYMVMALNQQIE